MVAGAALCAAALMLTRLSPTTSTAYLLASYVIFGLGFGLVNPPITNTAVSGMPPSQAGGADAVASTSRQVGQTPTRQRDTPLSASQRARQAPESPGF